jgi:diguanylate cyclase (GGDEF)-like protein
MTRPPSYPRAVRITGVAIALGVAIHALYALTGLGGRGLHSPVDDWLYTAVELLAVGLCAARVVAHREDRTAWALMTAGLIVWSGGDLCWTLWLEHLANPPVPSIADGLYLAMYPFMYASLLLLIRAKLHGASPAQWLDGGIVGITLAAIAAQLVMPTLIAANSGRFLEDAVNLSYPLGDLALLALVVLAFSLTGWRPSRIWLWIGAGVVLSAAADLIYVYQVADGSYASGTILDTLWPLSMGMIAFAAWQSRKRKRSAVRPQTILLPLLAASASVLLLVYAACTHVTPVAVALAAGSVTLSMVRGALSYMENARMLRVIAVQTVTDSLTGLFNRRALMDDLDHAVRLTRDGVVATLAFFDLDGFKAYNDTFGHTAGDSLLARIGTALANSAGSHGRAYRLGGDEFCVLFDGRVGRNHCSVERSTAALTEGGSAFTIKPSVGVAVLPDDACTASAALQLADRRMYLDKGNGSGRRRSGETRDVLMQLLTERTPDLHEHVHEVGRLVFELGRHFRLDAEDLDELQRGAELHDIGKLAIPDEILRKPGPLSQDEWQFMRQHPVIGERILNADPALRPVARLVRASHERWDGRGYPDGLAGPTIPLGARIIAACDAFEAMTTPRVYQAARTSSAAVAELRREAGKQFDPAVVDALCRQIERAEHQRRSLDMSSAATASAAASAPPASRRESSARR